MPIKIPRMAHGSRQTVHGEMGCFLCPALCGARREL
jgi:hypothetical protein